MFHLTDVFIACLDQFSGFFDVGGCFAYVVVVFESYELSVDERVLDVLVTQETHYVKDVFRLMVFHRCFPVAEGVKGYLPESWVSELLGCSCSLSLVRPRESSDVVASEYPVCFLGHCGKHR